MCHKVFRSLEVGFHNADHNVVDIEVTHVINFPHLPLPFTNCSIKTGGGKGLGRRLGHAEWNEHKLEGKEEADQTEVQLTLTSNHQSHTPCGHPSKIRHSTGVDSCVIEYQAVDLQL